MVMPRGTIFGLVVSLLAVLAHAAERAPGEVAAEIDRHIEARLAKEKITVSRPADDAEFLRRAALDLTGRVPSPERVVAFLDSRDAEKRAKAIDELLAQPEFGGHFGNVWHDLITPRTPISDRIKPEALRSAFAAAFNENRPWSETVGRLVLCQEKDQDRNFLAFHRVNGDMGGKPMANVVGRSFARLFLGVKLECAECHDDPFRPWTQDDYWGMAAFFGRVEVFQDKDNKIQPTMIVEGRGYTPPKGNNFRLPVKPNGALVIHEEAREKVAQAVLPRVLEGEPVSAEGAKPHLPTLAAWLASPDNPYFASAAVNRFWNHLFARGLVNPVDDAAFNNPASHPAVMELLTKEFVGSGHDVKHLLRCLMLTRAYQRTSRAAGGNEKLDDPLYARMPLKVLTSEMLLESLRIAYEAPLLVPLSSAPLVKRGPPVFAAQDFLQLFRTNDPEGSASDYLHGIPQVLHLLNTPRFGSGGKVVERLIAARPSGQAAEDCAAEIEALYLRTLSRRPTVEELKRKIALVREHESLADGLNGVLWTLVNQSEFLVNH